MDTVPYTSLAFKTVGSTNPTLLTAFEASFAPCRGFPGKLCLNQYSGLEIGLKTWERLARGVLIFEPRKCASEQGLMYVTMELGRAPWRDVCVALGWSREFCVAEYNPARQP